MVQPKPRTSRRKPTYVCQFLIVLPGTDPLAVGYADFLQIIRDPEHPEHAETLAWVGGAFDADAFDPASVKFDDPRKRWRTAFQEG